VTELLSHLAEGIDGEPVAIVVSRRNLLKSATIATQKAEFSYSRPPFISFDGEDAEDDGGPRREFFRSKVKTFNIFDYSSSNTFHILIYNTLMCMTIADSRHDKG